MNAKKVMNEGLHGKTAPKSDDYYYSGIEHFEVTIKLYPKDFARLDRMKDTFHVGYLDILMDGVEHFEMLERMKNE